MDLLKQELAKKRKATTAGFGGKSFVRRSELEQKKLQQIRDEHLAKVKAKGSSTDSDAGAATDATAQAAEGNLNPSSSAAAVSGSASASVPPALAAKKTTQEEALLSEERRIDELDLPRNEVIRRLRVLRQPVTLFGEDDAARLERFKLVLKSGVIDDIDDLDRTEGQTNDFLVDMIEMRKRQKTGRDTYAKSKGKRVGGGGEGGAGGDSADDGGGKGSGDDADGDKDAHRMRANFEELCNEDKILVFFKKLLNEWKQELDDMSELEKRTAKGKQMVATFKQCARYLSPLLEFCRKKVRILLLSYPIKCCLNCVFN
jgi:pre-mRNA-splicing factor 18